MQALLRSRVALENLREKDDKLECRRLQRLA